MLFMQPLYSQFWEETKLKMKRKKKKRRVHHSYLVYSSWVKSGLTAASFLDDPITGKLEVRIGEGRCRIHNLQFPVAAATISVFTSSLARPYDLERNWHRRRGFALHCSKPGTTPATEIICRLPFSSIGSWFWFNGYRFGIFLTVCTVYCQATILECVLLLFLKFVKINT